KNDRIHSPGIAGAQKPGFSTIIRSMIKKHHLNPILFAGIPAAVLVLAACTCSSLSSLPVAGPTASSPLDVTSESDLTADATSTEALPPPDSSGPVDKVVFQTLPARDRYDLAARFKGITDAKPAHTADNLPKVGDEEQFWVDDDTNNVINQITAKLIY